MATAQQHLDWGRNRAREFNLIGAQAQVDAFEGRLQRSRELQRQTTEMADARGFPQIALGYGALAAWTTAIYGDTALAATEARAVLARNPSVVPRLRAAAALALAGEPGEAERHIKAVGATGPTDTFVVGVHLPVAQAAVHLARRQPVAALDMLRAAAPFELGNVASLAPLYLRGEAYLQQAAGAAAAKEFQSVLDHRGVDPFSPLHPRSRLGLARALANAGNTAESRRAYEALLTAWAQADADVPVLVAARQELARLTDAGR